jgi:hypothetical protein
MAMKPIRRSSLSKSLIAASTVEKARSASTRQAAQLVDRALRRAMFRYRGCAAI